MKNINKKITIITIFATFIFLLFVPSSIRVKADTALPVDAYISFEGSPTGGAYITTSGGSLTVQGSPTVSSTNARALRGPVSVNGVTYNGDSTQALTINNDHTYEDIVFNATAKHDVISFAGFINVGSTNTYAMIDMFYIDNTAGNSWLCAPQVIDESTCHHCVQLEGSIGGHTVHGTLPKWQLPIEVNKTYWFSTKVDTPGRMLYLSIFDPDNNYALVGNWSIETDGLNGNLELRMGRADNHANNPQNSYSYIDNIIIDWTNHAYPLIPGSAPAVDTTPPSVPTNLSATAVSSTQINLSWTASTDNVGVTGYKIYRGGTQIATSTTTSYSNTGLSASTTYTYTVSAYDTAGNVSAQSSLASAMTPAADTTAPIISNVLASSITNRSANILWTTDENSDSQVEYGRTISYGSQTSIKTSMVTSHSVSLSGLRSSTLYHYRVKSKDAAGNFATSEDYTFTTLKSRFSINRLMLNFGQLVSRLFNYL